MARLLSNASGDILVSRGAKSLLDELQRNLESRMVLMTAEEGLELLCRFRAELLAEENVDAEHLGMLTRLCDSLATVRFNDELNAICNRFPPLLSDHFRLRSSVTTVHFFCKLFYERLMDSALKLAVELLTMEGLPAPLARHVLLADSGLGRSEPDLFNRSRFFLVHEDESPFCKEYFGQLAVKVAAILADCGMQKQSAQFHVMEQFRSYSLWEWQRELAQGLLVEYDPEFKGILPQASDRDPMEKYIRMFETLADLRMLSGDVQFGNSLVTEARELLDRGVADEKFWQLSKQVASMPIALGIFGRFRISRSGKHRGEFSLEQLAITPLVAAIRILSIKHGVSETSTGGRLRALLSTGNIGVALADRLLVAYHDFLRCQINLEFSHGGEPGELYMNPESLDEVAKEKFKAGLEDLGTLQRLVYQQVVEVDL